MIDCNLVAKHYYSVRQRKVGEPLLLQSIWKTYESIQKFWNLHFGRNLDQLQHNRRKMIIITTVTDVTWDYTQKSTSHTYIFIFFHCERYWCVPSVVFPALLFLFISVALTSVFSICRHLLPVWFQMYAALQGASGSCNSQKLLIRWRSCTKMRAAWSNCPAAWVKPWHISSVFAAKDQLLKSCCEHWVSSSLPWPSWGRRDTKTSVQTHFVPARVM